MTDTLSDQIPVEFGPVFAEIVELTDRFCADHLDRDYQQLCREMAVAICQEGSPVRRGRPASWASGIVHALGWVNFLSDPGVKPHLRSEEVAKGFGVSTGTMLAKSKIIRDGLDIFPFDPDWCIPSMLEHNPLVWMLETTSGAIIDVRHAPLRVQQEAYEKGLIPYIPAGRKQDDSDDEEDDSSLEDELDGGSDGRRAGPAPPRCGADGSSGQDTRSSEWKGK